MSRPDQYYTAGSNFFDKGKCTDVQCPDIGRSWIVAIDKGGEKDFAGSVLQREGYTESNIAISCPMKQTSDSCMAEGTKDGLKMTVTVYFADPSHYKIPNADVSPKIWRYVQVDVRGS